MRSRLSIRELEIARLLAEGYMDKEIAAALGISIQTVKNHFTSMMDKKQLERRTRTALLTAMIKDGDVYVLAEVSRMLALRKALQCIQDLIKNML